MLVIDSESAFTPLKPGECLPNLAVDLENERVDVRSYFSEMSGLVFGISAPFGGPKASARLIGFREAAEFLKSRVGFVGCICMSDPDVLRAWAKQCHVSKEFTFISDSFARISTALGVVERTPTHYVTSDFAAILENGRVVWLEVGSQKTDVGSVMTEIDKRYQARAASAAEDLEYVHVARAVDASDAEKVDASV